MVLLTTLLYVSFLSRGLQGGVRPLGSANRSISEGIVAAIPARTLRVAMGRQRGAAQLVCRRHTPRATAGIRNCSRENNLHPHQERIMRSIKEEALSKMIFFGETMLRDAVGSYLDHYRAERNHQRLDNSLIEPGVARTVKCSAGRASAPTQGKPIASVFSAGQAFCLYPHFSSRPCHLAWQERQFDRLETISHHHPPPASSSGRSASTGPSTRN